MQKTLLDFLNAGIALYRTGESGVSAAIKQVKDSYEELAKKGASDNSEAISKIRTSIEDITDRVDQLSGKAGAAYKDGLTHLEGKYTNLLEQIKNLFPEEKLGELKDKINDLSKAIKEKVSK